MFNVLSALVANENFFKWLSVYGPLAFGLYFLVNELSSILFPFVGGLIGAYILSTPAKWLEKRGLSRNNTALLLVTLLVFLVVFLFIVVTPILREEFSKLMYSVPQFANRVLDEWEPFLKNLETKGYIEAIRTHLTTSLGDLVRWSAQFVVQILGNGLFLTNFLLFAFLTPIVLYYLIRDWPRLILFICRFLPRPQNRIVFSVLKQIDHTLRAYARGHLLVCVILSGLYIVSLMILGLKQAFLVGLLSGFLSFIPFLGFIAGILISMSLALSQFSQLWPFAAIFAIYVVTSLLEGKILIPRFVGERIGVHPVLVLFAVFSFGKLFGFWGVVFALPLAAICRVLIGVYFKKERLQKQASESIH